MHLSRRNFFASTLGLISLSVINAKANCKDKDYSTQLQDPRLPSWSFPDLATVIGQPVWIRSVELLKTQEQLLLVVTAKDGTKGVTQCNDRTPNLISLLKGLVIGHFVDKDARSLPMLVDNAYRLNSNYKYAGMPLWNSIGSVEIAVWDLLGRIANKPVYELLGKPVRKEYGVYISDFNREGDPERITDQLLAKLDATGSRGVKIKIGGRMVNTPENSAQTRRYIPVLRKKLGNSIAIYADANGSYTPEEGIEAGHLLEDHGIEIFEEPCNFEDEEGMKTVNDAMTKLKLAGGEQDTSVYRFQRLARNNVYDILQPDLYYNGGILRTLQVAEIARTYGKNVAPHTPKADPLIAPFWHVAALVPNLYGLQEYVYSPGETVPSWHTRITVKDGIMKIPDTNGLGIDYDDGIWKSAIRII
jgi:L-alanine-DL-glutamate epimerase-like enolase superfamily enzyme